MSTYFSHGDDLPYEPPRKWEPLPVPTHIRETIEGVVFKARASHAAMYLLLDILGPNTYELHDSDLAQMRRSHE